MSSAFERLQKIAQQKKDSEKEKPTLELANSKSSKITIDNQINEVFDIPNQPNIDNQPNQPNQPNIDNQPNQALIQDNFNDTKFSRLKTRKTVSPERDYTKVPNSVTRDIVPERLFKGMSKNTYDALYLKTRGAVNPIREIRATKSDLLRWTGVSDVTLDKHLKHLRSVGLVNWKFIIGSHNGNLYEVFVPEELDLTNLTNLTIPNVPKKVGGDVPNFLGYVGGVQISEDKGLSQPSKTSLKTNTYDDEKNAAFLGFVDKFEKITEKLTGKKLNPGESSKWEMLADLLILELEIAAKRSNSISSIPAFLTEVLRRQLFIARHTKSDKEKNQNKNSNINPDTVGKPLPEAFEIKPLSKEEREVELYQMREFAKSDFLDDFKKWYTDEDWKWILENLLKIQ